MKRDIYNIFSYSIVSAIFASCARASENRRTLFKLNESRVIRRGFFKNIAKDTMAEMFFSFFFSHLSEKLDTLGVMSIESHELFLELRINCRCLTFAFQKPSTWMPRKGSSPVIPSFMYYKSEVICELL